MGHRRGSGRARSGRRRTRDHRRQAVDLRQAGLGQSAFHRPHSRRSMTIVEPNAATITEAAKLLRDGDLVAFPTETVYGLGGDATNERAVAAIFEAKGRPQFNPLISHVLGPDEAKRLVRWNDTADRLATRLWPGPLTLVLPRAKDSPIALLTTAGLDTVAVRAPAHPLAQGLIRAVGRALAAPSAQPRRAGPPHRAR